jgi:hypothetical protein
MNLKFCKKMTYENKSNWTLGENKPNSNPIKPNFLNAQMNVSSFITKDYKKKMISQSKKTNPIQTQSKPILERMNVNFYAKRCYDRNPTFAANNSNVEFTTVFSDGARFITPKADKIALKIYPFGIDCPIVLKEMLFSIYGKDYD